MSTSEIVGSIGVTLLLIAFFMNSFALLDSRSLAYQAMNAVGAAVSCYASYLIGFAPFVVLEAVWCAAALARDAPRPRPVSKSLLSAALHRCQRFRHLAEGLLHRRPRLHVSPPC